LLTTYTVTNTNDSGPGSLRQTILDGNVGPDAGTIVFDIAGAGVHTIRPSSPLPVVTNPMVIDGTTQPGFAGAPLIELTGSGAGNGAIGLEIAAGNSVVRGLVINAFAGDGIELETNGDNVIAGNYIGTTSTGYAAQGNGYGVYVLSGSDNTIGGTTAADRNLISGNVTTGITLHSGGNRVEGDYIGTDVSGLKALKNGTGVELTLGSANVIGGTGAGAGNLISGNSGSGVSLGNGATNNVVQGNFIGPDVNGYAGVPNNTGIFIDIGSTGNTIGGTAGAARNLISGNNGYGMSLAGGNNLVQGNYLGLTVAGNAPLGNGGDNIYLTGLGNTIGGTTAAARNVIGGNNSKIGIRLVGASGNVIEGNYLGTNASGTAGVANYAGLDVGTSYNNTIGGTVAGAGNLISGNREGIEINNGSNNFYQGNFIGPDVTGTLSLANGSGIISYGGSLDTFGGTVPGAGNLISGNTGSAISLSSGDGNVIQGNLIGTSVTGTKVLANGNGISISFGSAYNTIGGTTPGARNVVSGNNGDGIVLYSHDNRVQGNYVGTDSTGTKPFPNHGDGVSFQAGTNNLIGGDLPGAGNLLSGNTQRGVYFYSGTGNFIEGNFIGTDSTGTQAVPNSLGGIFCLGGSLNTIGGTSAGTRNLISGNALFGISIITPGNLIEGNFIGTDVTGTKALGNGPSGAGILIGNDKDNQIGGTLPGAGNLISGNSGPGISITTSSSNRVQGNYIGTDISGTQAVPNGQGIVASAGTITIGGTAAGARNLISGNLGEGILLQGGVATAAVIQGNWVGTDVTGSKALGNGTGVSIAGSNYVLGGNVAGAGNLISGNQGDGVLLSANNNRVAGNFIGTDVTGTKALGNLLTGVAVSGSNDTVGGIGVGAGNLISGNGGDGVTITGTADSVLGNFIGTDHTGAQAVKNLNNGVAVTGSNNTIGGTTSAQRNLISGNALSGISLSGNGNLVLGNFVGTNVSGTEALPNATGVTITADSNRVGGVALGEGNLISGNQVDGVAVLGGTGSLVQGNFIGTDMTGGVALPNSIGLSVNAQAVIGGTMPAARNLISGNSTDGIYLAASAAVVEGNYIGTDVSGGVAVPNSIGLSVNAQAVIGGTTPAARNLISGNSTDGIYLAASGAVVEGNYIGTNVSGMQRLGNVTGVYLDTGVSATIGGTVAGAGNLISANNYGILVLGSAAQIQGNRIGTDATGTQALGNTEGIVLQIGSAGGNVIGGMTPEARNLVSGNMDVGIAVMSNGANTIQGNYLGTDATGTHALGNRGNNVLVNPGSSNLIGGTDAGAGNLISGSSGHGIDLLSSGNIIQGNRIGTDVSGASELGNAIGIEVEAPDNTIGGTTPGAANLISGNSFAGLYVSVGSTGSHIEGNEIGTDLAGAAAIPNLYGVYGRGALNLTIGGTAPGAGNLISGNSQYGIYFPGGTSGVLVEGNFIGTNGAGSGAIPNEDGVYLENAPGNVVGGTIPGSANVISGNGDAGVYITGTGATGNRVEGNWIGTDATGSASVPNVEGVYITGASGNIVGGTDPAARNVISGNNVAGVELEGDGTTGNVVEGNFIGTDVTGTSAVPNDTGVELHRGSDNTIGGIVAGAGNLISGNHRSGIHIVSDGNWVQGNRIGTDVTGTAALGNGRAGVELRSGANNVIGGTTAAAGNLIAANAGSGIDLCSNGNLVQGNFIGTDATGLAALGNGGDGIRLRAGSSDNTIGGTTPAAGNTIAFNGNDGVLVDGGTGNAIRGNRMFSDSNLGIELIHGGNQQQPAPDLISAVSTGGFTTITGTLQAAPDTTFLVELFVNNEPNASGYGEGEEFLGYLTATTGDDGTATFTFGAFVGVDPGQFISATATDPANNTSQFARCVEVSGPEISGLPSDTTAIPIQTGGCISSGLDASASGRSGVGTTEAHWDSMQGQSFSGRAEAAESRSALVQTGALPLDLTLTPCASDRFFEILAWRIRDLDPWLG
jgi:hypothetical protein